MKKFLFTFLLAFVVFFGFYFIQPVINYGFIGLPIILVLTTIIAILTITSFQLVNKSDLKTIAKPSKILFIFLGLLLFYILILPLFTSLPLFRSESFRQLIGKVNDGSTITNHIAPISIDKIRVVDKELAYLLGEKILGSQPSLGSQVELGDFCIQKVGTDLYWVAPLLHSGFFKWISNLEGTPGYVMVSATNERDVKLVQSIEGKDIKIKYQPGAFFGSEIARHIYFNGFTTIGLTDFTFEIDDKGKPHYVVTKYLKKIGFSGNDATGVVIVDAQTGVIKDYAIADVPKWVDRIQPIDLIEDQLNDWGNYVHGYFNFSNADKLQITEGLTLVYGKDNKSYWYTGLTSVGKDESAVGFVLVDTRTKEATFYKQSGATEYAAQSSAQGKVQEKGFKASLPIPYNINNIPTYVMTLKDEGGLVKMYAMVAISDYTIVGVGNSLREALTSFKSTYNMAGNKLNSSSLSNKTIVETIVTRITNDVKNGNSFYYFTIKDSSIIFIGSSQRSSQLPLTIVGDSIKISYDIENADVIDVSSFENKSLLKKINDKIPPGL